MYAVMFDIWAVMPHK